MRVWQFVLALNLGGGAWYVWDWWANGASFIYVYACLLGVVVCLLGMEREVWRRSVRAENDRRNQIRAEMACCDTCESINEAMVEHLCFHERHDSLLEGGRHEVE